jgi:hypothetical protein
MLARIVGGTLLASICCVNVFCSSELPPGVALAARARYINGALLKQVPSYTCLDSISRSEAPNERRKLKHRDTVQIDVGVAGHSEMFSWPGEAAFSSEELSSLIGHGLIATGLFEGLAGNLFVLAHGNIHADREETLDGRPAIHFLYTTPSLENQWLLNWQGRTGVLGERGEFWVDKQTFALIRLKVTADSIPATVALKKLEISIDYEPVILLGKAALLPRRAQVLTVDDKGTVLLNEEVFSHCRVFESEARLTDGSQQLGETLTKYEQARKFLPPGVTFTTTLKEPISIRDARIGDPIHASLDQTLTLASGVRLEKGTPVGGRVREMQPLPDAPNTFVAGLEFDQIEEGTERYSFFAQIAEMEAMPGISLNVKNVASTEWLQRRDLMTFTTRESITPVALPGSAVFLIQGVAEIPRGLKMVWRTKRYDHAP